MAFAVPTLAELSDWERRFAAAGLLYTRVAPANSIAGAAVVVFRDPDNIQLEPRRCRYPTSRSAISPVARNTVALP